MEGFVNNKVSAFDNGLKHSNSYANFGVDKINNPDESQKIKNDNINKVNEPNKNKQLVMSSDIFIGNIADNITDNIDKVVVETVTAPNQDRNQRIKTAGVVGGSMLCLGAISLIFKKGKLSKGAIKSLGKIIEKANVKIEELKQKPTMSNLEGAYLTVLQKTNNVASRVRGAFFNITPLKDVLFSKLIKKKLGLKKVSDVITDTFGKLSFAKVKSGYERAGENIDRLTNLFSETNTRIASGEFAPVKKVPSQEFLKGLEDKNTKIRTEFVSNFNPSKLEYRNKLLLSRFYGLDKRVYNNIYGKMKDFVTDVDEWTTFVPERIVAKDKSAIMANLSDIKRVITNNPSDNYNRMSDILTKLDGAIDPKDKDSRNAVKNLKLLTERYIEFSGPEEDVNRAELVKKINSHLKRAIKSSVSDTYSTKQTKRISSLLRQFGEIINKDKKGAIEELLTQYKQYLPEVEYYKLKKAADKTIKSLNRAVNIEGNEYVDKVRDLSCGSALTDVAIGMTLPLATTSLAMASAKTKEQKRSVALKYGLPLLTGIMASTVATLRLISGGKALMFGAGVSILSNELFERLDNHLKERDKKRGKL